MVAGSASQRSTMNCRAAEAPRPAARQACVGQSAGQPNSPPAQQMAAAVVALLGFSAPHSRTTCAGSAPEQGRRLPAHSSAAHPIVLDNGPFLMRSFWQALAPRDSWADSGPQPQLQRESQLAQVSWCTPGLV